MQLAYSTNAFTRTDLESALRAIARIGYSAAELLCDRPHWFATEVSDQHADAIGRLITDLGLTISNLNANTANGYYTPAPPENVFEPALTNADPHLRRWRQDYTIACLALAKRVGAPCVSVTSGHPTPGVLPERALDWFVDSLTRICDEAAKCDVRVGIEYEPGLLVERATELLEVLHRVGSPDLGVNLDIGHSYLEGEDPDQIIDMLRGRIWNVHVEDIKDCKHFHRVPGDGDMPFEQYFAALGKAGYDGNLTVELYSYPDIPEQVGERALAYLSGMLS